MNRNIFYNYIRAAPFGGSITQNQVNGVEHILDYWDKNYSEGDVRWLAYALATVFRETGGLMLPVKEKGSDKYLSKYDTGKLAEKLGNTPAADGDGVLFAGRGLIQITGRSNYRKYGIEDTPDKALDPDFAVFILFDGMEKGTFTGKKFSDYFNGNTSDPVGARRIINGTDKSQLIASYYKNFLDAITAANKPEEAKPEEKAPLPTPPKFYEDPTFQTTVATSTLGSIGSLVAAINNPWALLGVVVFVAAGGLIGYFVIRARHDKAV